MKTSFYKLYVTGVLALEAAFSMVSPVRADYNIYGA